MIGSDPGLTEGSDRLGQRRGRPRPSERDAAGTPRDADAVIDFTVPDATREYAESVAEAGVHVRRAGTVPGEHELLVAGNDEVVSLTHRAESRRAFAAGAVDAAEWLAGKEPGRSEFGDVL